MDDLKDCFFNYSLSIQKRNTGFDPSTGQVSNSFSNVIDNIQCAFWHASDSESYRSGKLEPHVEGVIVVKKSDLMGRNISDSDKILLSNNKEYSVVKYEDVMGFSESMEIEVKRYENG